jgi:hypothetical protein
MPVFKFVYKLAKLLPYKSLVLRVMPILAKKRVDKQNFAFCIYCCEATKFSNSFNCIVIKVVPLLYMFPKPTLTTNNQHTRRICRCLDQQKPGYFAKKTYLARVVGKFESPQEGWRHVSKGIALVDKSRYCKSQY